MRTKRKTGAVPNRSYLEKGPTKEQKQRRGLLKDTLHLENDPMKVEDNFTPPSPSRHSLRRLMSAGKPKSKPVRRFSFGSTGGQKLRKNDSSHSLPGLNRNDKTSMGRTGRNDADNPATPDGIMSNAVRRVIERQGKGTVTRAKTDGTDLMAMRRSLQDMYDKDDDSCTAPEESGSGFLKRGLVKLENLYETCK
jgi:hypothetical protein